jgi:hypothetical protein
MATTVAVQRGSRDRRLYIGAAVVIPIVVLIGFAPTYYLKSFFDTPALPGLMWHLHGVVMTAWVVLFVTQVSLVATGRTRVHKRLGVLGAALAATVVVFGVVLPISAVRLRASTVPLGPQRQFLVVPFGDMLVFAVLAGTALYFRRRIETHKRLMLLAALSLLDAAFSRFPLHFIETGGPMIFWGLTDLCAIAFVAFDTVRNRRLHPAFLWGTLLMIASQLLRLMLAGTDTWMRFATWLIGQ